MSPFRSLFRSKPVLALIVVGSCAALLALGAREARASAAVAVSVAQPVNDELEQAMRQMNTSLKVLGKGVSAETQEAALQELAKFQSALISAKGLTPDAAAEVDAAKRPKFVAEFRKMLLDALKLACDAEVAIVDGKFKDADTLIRNKLVPMKSSGHSKFQTEKDEEGGKGGKSGH